MAEQPDIESRARKLYNEKNGGRPGMQDWDQLNDVVKRAFILEAEKLADAEEVNHG
jgi:hypothetical protein